MWIWNWRWRNTTDLWLQQRVKRRESQAVWPHSDGILSVLVSFIKRDSFKIDKICLASALKAEIMTHLRTGVDNVAAGATYQHVDREVT